jgi:YgiT-type zinc finger domain-containing protein
MELQRHEADLPGFPCPQCGEITHSAMVRTAIWREEHLFVVEDIPAQICSSCMEQFYDEETSDALRRLTEENFLSVQPRREVLVPIFSLEGQIHRRTPSEEEVYPDY